MGRNDAKREQRSDTDILANTVAELLRKQVVYLHLVIRIDGESNSLEEIEGFLSKEDAAKFEEELCKQHNIPFDEGEREKYYDDTLSPCLILRRDVEIK